MSKNFSKVAVLTDGNSVGIIRKAKHKSRVCDLSDPGPYNTDNTWLVETSEIESIHDRGETPAEAPQTEAPQAEEAEAVEAPQAEEAEAVEAPQAEEAEAVEAPQAEEAEEAPPAEEVSQVEASAGDSQASVEAPEFLNRLPQPELKRIFDRLNTLLSGNPLKCSDGSSRSATAREFVWMGRDHHGFNHFKHVASENYVYVDPQGGLYVPEKPEVEFQRGVFDSAS